VERYLDESPKCRNSPNRCIRLRALFSWQTYVLYDKIRQESPMSGALAPVPCHSCRAIKQEGRFEPPLYAYRVAKSCSSWSLSQGRLPPAENGHPDTNLTATSRGRSRFTGGPASGNWPSARTSLFSFYADNMRLPMQPPEPVDVTHSEEQINGGGCGHWERLAPLATVALPTSRYQCGPTTRMRLPLQCCLGLSAYWPTPAFTVQMRLVCALIDYLPEDAACDEPHIP
jgi:hypothetical protein